MRVRRQALKISVALLFGVSLASQAQTASVSGYIYGMHGDWSANNPYVPKLQLGQAVYAKQSIKPSVQAAGCYINIGYADGSLFPLDCGHDTNGYCKAGYTVTGFASDSNWKTRLGEAWTHLFNHGPVPVVFAMSRGAGGVDSKGPQEAVLAIDQGRLDPAPALRDLDPGDYALSLRAIPDAGAAPVRLRCKWNSPVALCAAGTHLIPGLFTLTVSSDDGRAGSPVAVLLTSASHFDTLTRNFELWKAATQSWPKDTHPETIHYFRTAALDALNQAAHLP